MPHSSQDDLQQVEAILRNLEKLQNDMIQLNKAWGVKKKESGGSFKSNMKHTEGLTKAIIEESGSGDGVSVKPTKDDDIKNEASGEKVTEGKSGYEEDYDYHYGGEEQEDLAYKGQTQG